MIAFTSRFVAIVAASIFAGAALAPTTALAQQPAAPSATPSAVTPAASAAPIPKSGCTHPGEFPGKLASERQQKQWQKDYVGYVDCLRKFVTDQQAIAEPHVKAANAAVEEYNRAVKEYNDTVQKLKEE